MDLFYNGSVPKFRKKYTRKGKTAKTQSGSDAVSLRREKEDRGLRSSSLAYKDDIDSV